MGSVRIFSISCQYLNYKFSEACKLMLNHSKNILFQYKVSVVITIYKNFEESLLCLNSLIKSSERNFEVVLVLNSILDESELCQYAPFSQELCLRIFQQSENTGAAKGRNIGASHARGQHILFLDSDNVVSANLISHLSELLDADKSVGLVGPLMLHYDSPNLIWQAGANLSDWTCLAAYEDFLMDIADIKQVRRITGHIPNCFMIRASDFHQIGGFREIYFIMYEEADLAARVRLELGLGILLSFECQSYHMVDVSPPGGLLSRIIRLGVTDSVRAYLTTRNRLIYSHLNCSFLKSSICFLFFAPLATFLYAGSCLAAANFPGFIAVLKGYLNGLSYSIFSSELFKTIQVDNAIKNTSIEINFS